MQSYQIVSPGGVCKGITPENLGTVSLTRNNIIVNLLHHSDYIEQLGAGINRMRNAAREAHVAEPELEKMCSFYACPKLSQTH